MVTKTTIGTGNGAITLQVAEDAYLGDAQFTVSVDGQQIDGTQVATASHAANDSQVFTVLGNFGYGTGPHAVTVNYLNDLYDGTPATDRNLYVGSVSSNGVSVPGAALYGPGPVVFQVPAAPSTIDLGSGADTIKLAISEDAYQGDAQFTVSVNGTPIGGVQTALASHAAGQDQIFALHGDFGTGPRTVTVNFLNDQYDGTAQTDRNLYVDRIDNSGVASFPNAGLYNNGPQNFLLPPLIQPVTVGTGPDRIDLNISEDAYAANGGTDALFTIAVDGTQVGGVQTAIAAHGAGQTQDFALLGNFGSGPHNVSISFVNDAYGGTAATDRNLYVDSVSRGGVSQSLQAALYNNGTQSFAV